MFIDGTLKIDERPKFLGWCPGCYLGQCGKCGDQYMGDKRAVMCADCAYKEIPEGYALVPVDPTPEMLAAGIAPKGYSRDGYPNGYTLKDEYKAMIAAAREL